MISIREHGTYWKRWDGSTCEPERFVNINNFFDIAFYYANKGFKVYRIGDSKQTPMPSHPNIIDLAKQINKRMLDDLFLLVKNNLLKMNRIMSNYTLKLIAPTTLFPILLFHGGVLGLTKILIKK